MVPDGLGGGLEAKSEKIRVFIRVNKSLMLWRNEPCCHLPDCDFKDLIKFALQHWSLREKRRSIVSPTSCGKSIEHYIQKYYYTWKRYWLTLAPQWAAISSKGAFWNFSTNCLLRSFSCSSTPTLSTEKQTHKLKHAHWSAYIQVEKAIKMQTITRRSYSYLQGKFVKDMILI